MEELNNGAPNVQNAEGINGAVLQAMNRPSAIGNKVQQPQKKGSTGTAPQGVQNPVGAVNGATQLNTAGLNLPAESTGATSGIKNTSGLAVAGLLK